MKSFKPDFLQDAWDAKLCAAEFRLVCKHVLRNLRIKQEPAHDASSHKSFGVQLLQILDGGEGEDCHYKAYYVGLQDSSDQYVHRRVTIMDDAISYRRLLQRALSI